MDLFANTNLTENLFKNISKTMSDIKNEISNMSSAQEAQSLHKKLELMTKLYLSTIKNVNSTFESFFDQVNLVKLYAYRLSTETARKISGEIPIHPLRDAYNTTKLDILYGRHIVHRNPEQELKSFYFFQNYY